LNEFQQAERESVPPFFEHSQKNYSQRRLQIASSVYFFEMCGLPAM
jgi:hypothetical protein